MTVETLESLSRISNIAVVVLTALLAVAGYFAWLYSTDLAALKEDELSRFKLESTKEIAKANEQAAIAEALAAESQLELAKFKAPRTLTDEQRKRIAEKVNAFSGTTFEVITYPGEPEPANFSNLIAEMLVQAGWIFNPNNTSGSLMGLASGVVVNVGKQAGSMATQAGETLVESLTAEGVSARLVPSVSLQVNPLSIAIKLQVGKKP
jgi:hypothetical protein